MTPQVITEWQVAFGVPGGLPVAVALGVLLFALAVLGSRPRGLGLARAVPLVVLRWASALCAFVLATQPTFWAEQRRSEDGQLAVVLDVSRSMSIVTEGSARSDHLQALVERWRKSPRASQVRWFTLGDALTPVELGALARGTETLAPIGASTPLFSRLGELLHGEELGALIVVSDGADTTGLSRPTTSARVHTVFTPDKRALRDDAVAEVRADQVAFLHGEAKVHATIASVGLGDRDLMVSLSRAGKLLVTRALHVPAGKEQSIELGFTPQDLGREVYSLRVDVDQEDDVPENNERSFLVRVVRDRLRALHVSGRPSWDQRFLRGFLKRDPSIDLISFFILRSVHDLTMSDPSELALIPFPTDELFRQHLSTFDLIVLQDFDYAPYQMAPYLPLIRDYVRNGGGLAMIGGTLSFDGGGYGETALAEVLPVKLRPTDPAGAHVVEGPFSPEPVTDMVHHPLLELYPDAAQTLAAFRALEPMVGANALLGVREGSLALLEHPKARTPHGEKLPILSVGSYGKGRVLALATDTSWHWSMPTAGKGGDPSAYDRFWDRSIRWLTRDPLLEPSSVNTDKEAYGPRAHVEVSALARDEGYRPLRHSELTLALLGHEGQVVSEQRVRSDDAGHVKAILNAPATPGVLWAALSRDGKELARTALLVELSGVELARPAPRPQLLQELARSSGGRYVASADDAPDLADFDATRSTTLGTERHAPFGEPLWATLLFAVIALEWVLRRRFGQV